MSNDEEPWSKRRLALLLLMAIVVILGAGIGTVTLTDSDPNAEGTAFGQLGGSDDGGDTVDDPGTSPAGTPDDPDDGTPADSPGGATENSDGGTPDSGTDESGADDDDSTDEDAGDSGDEADDRDENTGDGGAGGDEADDGGSGSPDGEVTVSLDSEGEGTLLEANGVMPGDAGTERMTLTNSGNRSGTVRLVRTDVTDLENGIVEPEAPVDDSPDEGELSRAIAVRMTFEYPDGTEVIVIGSESSYVTLSSLNDSESPETVLDPGADVTVRLEWRVDEDASNEIQSDGTVFDAVFQLRAPEA